jgi:hypothetical protein
MSKWGIIVRPMPLGEIKVETYSDTRNRRVATLTRVVMTALNRFVREEQKRAARLDKARGAKRKVWKKLIARKVRSA